MRVCRDLVVALLAAAASSWGGTLAPTAQPVLRSATFDWNDVPATRTDVGEVRHFLRSPTATLDELELHVSTLDPGKASHAPHHHPNEELVIVRDGTVEALVGGAWRRVGPGSVIFNASNDTHALRNAGTTPATYFVVNWRSPATPSARGVAPGSGEEAGR